jgi:hypothetical protein
MIPDGLHVPEFDAENHVYKVNGVRLPSVTGIINAAVGVNPFWTKEGRDAGTAMHAAIQYYAENDLDYESLAEETKPLLDSYIKFCEETQFTPDLIEQPIYHQTLMYCGMPDQVQMGRCVVDFKKGQHLPTHSLQLAAYSNMLPNPFIYERWTVQLMPGRYKMAVYPKQEFAADLNVFMSCLNIHNWRKNHGSRA